jgi:hypothetical protein
MLARINLILLKCFLQERINSFFLAINCFYSVNIDNIVSGLVFTVEFKFSEGTSRNCIPKPRGECGWSFGACSYILQDHSTDIVRYNNKFSPNMPPPNLKRAHKAEIADRLWCVCRPNAISHLST